VGAFLPQHEDVDALDPGLAFGGAFGARFTPHLSAEAELAYQRASASGPSGRTTLADVPFTASLRLRLPTKAAELSALAGGGIHFVSLRDDVDAGAGPPRPDGRTTAFGFHVGAAAAFNLSPTMLVGADARWSFVPAKLDGVDVSLDGLRVAVTLSYRL
jgi:opacity protein-like surface antigen